MAHCDSEQQARRLQAAIAERLGSLGLELHPEKTKIVYCKDANRRGGSEHTSFDFLGYTFRGRLVRGRRGFFVSFTPAISTKALKAKGLQIRAWHLNRRSGTDLSGLAEAINPGSARLDQPLRALLPLDVVLPCPAHRRASRTVGHAEVQTTARQPNPSVEMAARRAAASALALRSLVPPRITAGPDCGSRMTRDRHVRFSREREGEVPSRYSLRIPANSATQSG